jgi:hypothetical protein
VSQLADRRLRLVHGGRDLVVRDLEDLAQHKHRALGRRERLQHSEHRDRHPLGQLDVLGYVRTGEQGLGQPLADILLTPAAQRPEPVE